MIVRVYLFHIDRPFHINILLIIAGMYFRKYPKCLTHLSASLIAPCVVYHRRSNASHREHSHYYAPRQVCVALCIMSTYITVTPTPKYRELKFAAASPSCCLRHLLLTTVSYASPFLLIYLPSRPAITSHAYHSFILR